MDPYFIRLRNQYTNLSAQLEFYNNRGRRNTLFVVRANFSANYGYGLFLAGSKLNRESDEKEKGI